MLSTEPRGPSFARESPQTSVTESPKITVTTNGDVAAEGSEHPPGSSGGSDHEEIKQEVPESPSTAVYEAVSVGAQVSGGTGHSFSAWAQFLYIWSLGHWVQLGPGFKISGTGFQKHLTSKADLIIKRIKYCASHCDQGAKIQC